jgi:GT2 family glycosyltransferase
MKLSIVIISWNDLKDIGPCIESVFSETAPPDFEVIVTDNGSTDGSVQFIRGRFPKVRLVENGANIGYGAGNNRGFEVAQGDYVLILNPDTIIRDRAIDKLVAYADQHPETGAFGCRVLNADGSYQHSAYPLPTVGSFLVAALYLRFLGRLSDAFVGDTYVNWQGTQEREIGFQAGCCVLIQRQLLLSLNGFDEQLFHQFEDADLCFRVWKAGRPIRFFPGAEITHIGGQNRGRYPVSVILETHRSRYRFFYKHYGASATRRIRYVTLISIVFRFLGYSLLQAGRPRKTVANRLGSLRVLLKWHWKINAVEFSQTGREPNVGFPPLSLARAKLP